MGMANGVGGKVGGGANGKYNEMARMAMSHPAFLNQVIGTNISYILSAFLNQAEQRPQVVFGSHSQFEVKMHFRLTP